MPKFALGWRQQYAVPTSPLLPLRPVTENNFGVLIANIVPGFAALWSLSLLSESVDLWLGQSPLDSPTVGGFLYVTIASVAMGMTVSAVRWLVIDRIHQRTGIPEPRWDFSRLQQNLSGYKLLVEIHYHYYQFHANMCVSVVFILAARRLTSGWTVIGVEDIALLILFSVYFVTSRDNLRKYYSRAAMLLGDAGETMPADKTNVEADSESVVEPVDRQT